MGTYHELITIPTMKERFEYLKQSITTNSWGGNRIHNQLLYQSVDWKRIRDRVIIRDNGYDLAMDGYPVGWKAIVHHIVPITIEMINSHDPLVYSLDNLVLCGYNTHNALHYGEIPTTFEIVERKPNDTCPWRM